MFGLTACYGCESIAIVYLLIAHVRLRLDIASRTIDWYPWFWVTALLWTLYHLIVNTFYFDWTLDTYLVVNLMLDGTMLLASLSIVSVIVSETLSQYRHFSTERIRFSRIVYILAVTLFLAIGIACAIADVQFRSSISRLIYLWKFVANVVIAFFIDCPSIFLLRAMTFPITQPRDRGCLRWSVIAIVVATVLFAVRAIYNLLGYFDANPIDLWFARETTKALPKHLPVGIRVFNFAYDFVFNFGCSILSVVGMAALSHHEAEFDDDGFYRPNEVRPGPVSSQRASLKSKLRTPRL
jgi:hypothetical protein